MDLLGSVRRHLKGVCLAGLLLVGGAPTPTPGPSPAPSPSRSIANAKLHRIEEHLRHLPNVRSTLLCETPGARLGIVQLKQIHTVPTFDADLEMVMRSEYPDLAEHALAVYQEQYVLVGMVQDDIYEIVLALRRDLGMRSIFLEGWGVTGTGSMAAQEYANSLIRARERGLFSPSPLGPDMFPHDPAAAQIAVRVEELRYMYQAYLGRSDAAAQEPADALENFFVTAGSTPFSEDFLAVRYAFGAGTRAAADFGLTILPFENLAYIADIQLRYREAHRSGKMPDWLSITDGRENAFIAYLQRHARDKEVVVTTLGAAHALGGPASCPNAPPDAFADRVSLQDNLAVWNPKADLPMSVLEIEPLMGRNIDKQIGYNIGIAQMLIDELLTRRALREKTSVEQERQKLYTD